MIENFNVSDYEEALKNKNEIIDLWKELKEDGGKLAHLKTHRDLLKSELDDIMAKFQSMSTITNKIFKRREINTLQEKISDLKKELEEIERNIDKVNKSMERKQEICAAKESNSNQDLLKAYVKGDEKGIIITDAKQNDKKSIESPDIQEILDKVVMVHTTDFFPKNHEILTGFDGNKEIEKNKVVTYDGVEKECRALQHRHTVHFTLNARVGETGAGEGTWKGAKFMVIEPLKKHVDQFVCLNPSDAYTFGSVNLSNNAILMVREDAIDEIPQEEVDKYQIVRFNGNPADCLNNFLKLNGYDIFKTDVNSPGHFYSKYMQLEEALNCRDMFINYIRDNTYLSRDSIELTDEEVFTMFNMAKQNQNRLPRFNIFFDKLAEKNNISPDIFRFFITSGFVRTDDGHFTIKTDEEVFDVISDIHDCKSEKIEDYEKILNSNGIKIDEIKQFYDMYCEKEFENLSTVIDMEGFYREYGNNPKGFEIFEKKYKETMGDKCHLNAEELKRFYEKKFKRNEKEMEVLNKINDRLEKNNSGYFFVVGYDYEFDLEGNILNSEPKLKIGLLDERNIEEKLQEKEHILEIREGVYGKEINLDFNLKKPRETVEEYIERLTKYTENFSKYYDGHTVDESVRFDENGDLIEEQKIEKPNFEKVATSKEAISELQSKKIVREIRDEMNPDKTKGKAGTDYGE